MRDWQHQAFFNPDAKRIEMHLEARSAVTVRWNQNPPEGQEKQQGQAGQQGAMHERRFARGERIHTENSYKYPLPLFLQMLTQAGFKACKAWTDERDWFAVIHARV